MKVAIFSEILNNHQANLADELFNLLGSDFSFIEIADLSGIHKKGSTEDYSKRNYLIQSWKDSRSAEIALNIALTYDVCVFDGAWSYQCARMKAGKLSFEFSERWLKSTKNFLSPRLWRSVFTYHLRGWRNKPIYKLCASAFSKNDQKLFGTFIGKCYKFGYFTQIPTEHNVANRYIRKTNTIRLMWCARFINWKHPELAIECVIKLKKIGYHNIVLDMYGDGPIRESIEFKAAQLGLSDIVKFHGNVPNTQIQESMRCSDIFLFTSDKGEGWGAVANEALANGCCLVGSDEIGSIPYLVEDGFNGKIFISCNAESLTQNVKWLLDHPAEMQQMQYNAYERMKDVWSPKRAAMSLLRLAEDLSNGRDTSFFCGPCSKA